MSWHDDEAFGLRRAWQVARFGFELGERLRRQRASQLKQALHQQVQFRGRLSDEGCGRAGWCQRRRPLALRLVGDNARERGDQEARSVMAGKQLMPSKRAPGDEPVSAQDRESWKAVAVR